MREDVQPQVSKRPLPHLSGVLKVVVILALALCLNLIALALPPSWFEGWGNLGYLGVFAITALANA